VLFGLVVLTPSSAAAATLSLDPAANAVCPSPGSALNPVAASRSPMAINRAKLEVVASRNGRWRARRR
jgi:hypothetical protein